jgi:hypothetical protein
MEDADVVDDGDTLEISLGPEWAIAVSDADVREALGRIGWQRAVRIQRMVSRVA